jgi:dTDP-4-dehydrorhamnose reductase
MAGGPILITGGAGQLASSLYALAQTRGVTAIRVGRPEFDFDRPETIAAAFHAARPGLVVNAAAYTAVDAAQKDPAAAARANQEGPAALAALCREAGVPLMQVSTDYVFDGRKGAPYVETDPTAPQCVYGATKLAGEQAVLGSGAQAIVMRTSWVYSATGKNFVRTMLNAAQRLQAQGTGRLRVVADQLGCPTSADDLAVAILNIAGMIGSGGWRAEYGGVVHAAGTGDTTWHGLAMAAFEAASRHGRPMPPVDAITTAEYPTPAPRPADSRLDCTRLEQVFGQRLPPWRESVDPVVDRLLCAADDA